MSQVSGVGVHSNFVWAAIVVGVWLGGCGSTCPKLPAPEVSLAAVGPWREIESNGVPNHPLDCADYPNTPMAQEYEFRIPAFPSMGTPTTVTEIDPPQRFGVTVTGIPLDPEAAEWFDRPNQKWQFNLLHPRERTRHLDDYHGHVQPTTALNQGAYHYHGAPNIIHVAPAPPAEAQPILVGWAFDGYPIYTSYCYDDVTDRSSGLRKYRASYMRRLAWASLDRRPDGPPLDEFPLGIFTEDWVYRAAVGDLDECNGHVGVTPEFESTIYHYHLTDVDDYPSIPRCFRGTPTVTP